MNTEKIESNTITRTMGLGTAVCMLVGAIVGASIFIVPGQLASEIGPGVWISYLLGAILVLFKCFKFAQIGAVLPVPAANYQMCKRTVSDSYANIYLWVFVLTNIMLFPIMAKTFLEPLYLVL